MTFGTREYFIFLEENFILQSACELSLKTPQRDGHQKDWSGLRDLIFISSSPALFSSVTDCDQSQCDVWWDTNAQKVTNRHCSKTSLVRSPNPQGQNPSTRTHTLRHDPFLVPCMKRVSDSSANVCVFLKSSCV